jgi:hypothetical protein
MFVFILWYIRKSKYIFLSQAYKILFKYFFTTGLTLSVGMLISQSKTNKEIPCVVHHSTQLLGTPYRAGGLENGEDEQLITSVDSFDCVTLVEHLLATCLMENHFLGPHKQYPDYLRNIRYRNGIINGYTSRLHYFSEWLAQQEQNGYLTNISKSAGGIVFRKEIYYMTRHHSLYPRLKDAAIRNDFLKIENRLSDRTSCYVPLKNIKKAVKFIKPGDIIVITSSRPGLDVEHTGIAITRQGRIYLLHASSRDGRVVVSKQPLAQYVPSRNSFSGIIILRPSFVD